MGQALVAAAKSVSEDVYVHSLHCYFVRAGKPPPLCPQTSPVAPQLPLLGFGGLTEDLSQREERRTRRGTMGEGESVS